MSMKEYMLMIVIEYIYINDTDSLYATYNDTNQFFNNFFDRIQQLNIDPMKKQI